jgi:tripeptide aminopeptidase
VTSALVDDLVAFASIPGPTFAEQARLQWLEERLAGARGSVRTDGAGSLIWRLGDGRPRVLLLAHVDTVFPAETPLRFTERDGVFIGPGIGDNAAAVVTVADVVARIALPDDAPLAVAFTVGEEGLGNLRGAHEACERLRPESAIAVEGHGLDHVLVDAVGSVRMRVSVTGPGGHSWEDHGTPSAVHALLRLGAEVIEAGDSETPVNVGVVSGGQSVNTIAAEAEFVVEMRALDEEALNGFAREVDALRVDPPLAVRVEEVGRRPAGRLDRAAPLLAVVREIRERMGLDDALGAGSTDANAALSRGIPAVTLGVARGALMHTIDEWIDVSSLEVGADQLERVLVRLLGGA